MPFGREQPQLRDLLIMVLDHLLAGMILQALAYCWEERNEEVWLEEAQASFQMISNTKTHHQLHQQLKSY